MQSKTVMKPDKQFNALDATVIIPSLNPDEKLARTVDDLIAMGFSDIILVNDGSKKECEAFFPADRAECTLLVHEVNRGKGAALKTAFRYLMERGRETPGAVTVDGDGQHKAEDVFACAEAMCRSDSVILGVRDFDRPDVPRRSRLGNKTTSLVFRLFCGLKISDTQTGLRAIPFRYLPELSAVTGDRYEYETNMLLQMKTLRIPYEEVQIETVYIEENQTSHFRPVRDSLRIYGLILKFISSSLISSVIDLGVFFVLSLFLPALLGVYADAVSTVCARLISSAVNYTLNRSRVFRSTAGTTSSLVRYYALALLIVVLSSGSLSLLTLLFGMTNGSFAFLKTVLKFLIDSLLFLLSFRIQREWVFAAKTPKTAGTSESH